MADGGDAPAPAPVGDSAPAEPQEQSQSAAPDFGAAPPQSPQTAEEIEAWGEKLSKAELARLRDVDKRRKDLDRASTERFQQAAQMRNEAQQLAQLITSDQKAALRAAGLDPIKVAEQILSEAVEDANLTPEQRRLRDIEAENKRLREESEQRQKEQLTAQERQAEEHYTNEFSQAFVGALKPLNLPEDDLPELVSRMAHRVDALLDSGAPIDLQAIAEDVSDRYYFSPKRVFQGLSPEQLLERYPEEAELFRKALLAKAQPKQSPKPSVTTRDPVPRSKKGLTRAELDARITARLQGGA